MPDNWHRIEKIVKWTGLSVNAFAREIGLHRSENLYQIKRGNNGISRELADTISARYPVINKSWLLTGEGEMFTNDAHLADESRSIPFYHIDVIKFLDQRHTVEPAYHISLPFADNASFAAIWFGRSMEPEVPPGAIVVCAECSPDNILPGEQYLIRSDRFTGIRAIRKELYTTQLRLVPCNSADFDQIMLDLADIKHIYAIKAVIIRKNL
ncbi:MAG: hypothetical protein LBH06_09050 [Rikenellaceae bacterium]|jgi:hypothetical protein|nr:hypothetical protein [Rikenellaceae bacterium]